MLHLFFRTKTIRPPKPVCLISNLHHLQFLFGKTVGSIKRITDNLSFIPLDNGADMAYNSTIRKRQLLRIVGWFWEALCCRTRSVLRFLIRPRLSQPIAIFVLVSARFRGILFSFTDPLVKLKFSDALQSILFSLDEPSIVSKISDAF